MTTFELPAMWMDRKLRSWEHALTPITCYWDVESQQVKELHSEVDQMDLFAEDE